MRPGATSLGGGQAPLRPAMSSVWCTQDGTVPEPRSILLLRQMMAAGLQSCQACLLCKACLCRGGYGDFFRVELAPKSLSSGLKTSVIRHSESVMMSF